jgi:hypothetical protein
MTQHSIFFEEWLRSLREQYKFVIRNNDKVTLPSLTMVLHDVGFSDDELAQLRVEATMHVDSMPDDFVPDMTILNTQNIQAGLAHPSQCTCPQCIPIDESAYDAEGQPLKDIDPEQATSETGHVFPVAKLETSEEIESLTFEDSLVEDDLELEVQEESIPPDDDLDDPDTPKQMSMF